ncbi:hypothetical protein CANCADRAFT_43866 [Tortispora caseinolytica NRRL Y-17796]|uniref:Uncharacterized protein n=1 Tax=Tortispora caseinolytica NRRL Y-17796 TaxID=767744 RepID=A0A1E4TEN4_9ASCO|nr:hypothetical protein CANCADRAFT_43866 [Tortispora caseinolytica NRRL Y-17796]
MNPQLVVFDLDYTLWLSDTNSTALWCDTHIDPPIKSINNGKAVQGRHGVTAEFYPEVPDVLRSLKASGIKIVAASRTHTPETARQMLRELRVHGQRAIDYFDALEFGTGSKISHFERIKKKFDVDYSQMIFYDDEERNRDVQRQLGVLFVYDIQRVFLAAHGPFQSGHGYALTIIFNMNGSQSSNPNRTYPYGRVLPYTIEPEPAPAYLLDTIIDGLYVALKAGDYDGHPALFWLKELNAWLALKYDLPIQKRADLLRVIYDVILVHGPATTVSDRYCSLFNTLFHHRDLLEETNLVLDHTHLLKEYMNHAFPSLHAYMPPYERDLPSITRVVMNARHFFPDQSRQDILEAVATRFSTNKQVTATASVGILATFFPTRPSSSFPPETFLPTFFHIWALCARSYQSDFLFLDFMSRLAQDCLPEQSVPMRYAGIFTQHQSAFIVSACLRVLEIPVGSSRSPYASTGLPVILKDNKKNKTIRAVSRWFVYSIAPAADSTSAPVLDTLEEFLGAFKAFFHPSNSGSWSRATGILLCSLVQFFVSRWNRENSGDLIVPDSRRITPQMKERFVDILSVPIFFAIYSKNSTTTNLAQGALRGIIYLSPAKVLPQVLQQAYPALQGQLETHRTNTAIRALSIAARTFSRTPTLRNHITTILSLILPGIDANDLTKSTQSLQLFEHFANNVPFINISGECTDASLAMNWVSQEVMELTEFDFSLSNGEDKPELSEEDNAMILESSTAAFDEIVTSLLDRVFVLLENMPDTRLTSSSASPEHKFIQAIPTAFMAIFSALSPEMYDTVLNKLFNFVSDHAIYEANTPMAYLCTAIARIMPQKALDLFVPALILNIKAEIKASAGTSRSSEILPADRVLAWNLFILKTVVIDSGNALTHLCEDLFDVLRDVRKNCKGYIAKLNQEMLHNVLYALSATYVIHPSVGRAVDFSIGAWGRKIDPQSLKVNWYTPTPETIALATALFKEHVDLSLEALEESMNEASANSKDVVDKMGLALGYLLRAYSGTAQIQDAEGFTHSDTNSYSQCSDQEVLDGSYKSFLPVPPSEFRMSIHTGYYFDSHPEDKAQHEIQQTRTTVGRMLHSLCRFCKQQEIEDVSIMKALISAIEVFLTDARIDRSSKTLEMVGNSYSSRVKPYQIPGLRKDYPENLLVLRAYLYFLRRLRYAYGSRVCIDAERVLLEDLLDLAVSSYSEVRMQAQHSLEKASQVFFDIKPEIARQASEVLIESADTTGHVSTAKLKGAIYVLQTGTFQRALIRTATPLPKCIYALVASGSVSSHELTTIEAAKSLINSINENYRLPIASLTLLSDNIDLISPINRNVVNEVERLREIRQRKQTLLKKVHDEVERTTVELFNKDTTNWSMKLVCANILNSAFVHPEKTLSLESFRIVLAGVIDSHPEIRLVFMHIFMKHVSLLFMRSATGYDYTKMMYERVYICKREAVKFDATEYTEKEAQLLTSLADPDREYVLSPEFVPGWLVWPTHLLYERRYKDEDSELSLKDTDMIHLESCKKVITFDWITALGSLTCEEPSQIEGDYFNMLYVFLEVHLFTIYGMGYTSLSKLDILKLMNSIYGDGKDKNKSRGCAELCGGFAGSMRWQKKPNQDMYLDIILQFFSKVYDTDLQPENRLYWSGLISFLTSEQDLVRFEPLVKKIKSFRLDRNSNTAFLDASRLGFVHRMYSGLSWTTTVEEEILGNMLDNLDHPYKAVRESVGNVLSAIFRNRYHEGHPSLAKLIEANSRKGSLGVGGYYASEGLTECIRGAFEKLSKWRVSSEGQTAAASPYYAGSKTVLKWLHDWLSYPSGAIIAPIVPSVILPELLYLLDIKEDHELITLAEHCIEQISNIPYEEQHILEFIKSAINACESNRPWRHRLMAMKVVQVAFFRNLFLLALEDKILILHRVVALLFDHQAEVQQAVSATVSGIIRCLPSSAQEAEIRNLQKTFVNILKKEKLPARDSTSSATSLPEYQSVFNRRHAAVLGIGAIVSAFPYESPPPRWVPDLLSVLAAYASGNPGNIGKSAKLVLGDFKKARQDTWSRDMKIFTLEQLEDLEGVFWKSYFA